MSSNGDAIGLFLDFGLEASEIGILTLGGPTWSAGTETGPITATGRVASEFGMKY